MKNLNKEEMLWVLAELAVKVDAERDYKGCNTLDNNFKLLTICDDISHHDVSLLHGRIDKYISDVIEDNEVGYIRFRGRYSSWDCSNYYTSEVVYPRKIEQVVYETKLEYNES